MAELGADRDPVVGLAERGDALVLSLTGELDLYTAPAVRDALRGAVERAPKRLVVDLSGVTFIDSTALGTLVEARSRLHDGKAFALAAPGLFAPPQANVTGEVDHADLELPLVEVDQVMMAGMDPLEHRCLALDFRAMGCRAQT